MRKGSGLTVLKSRCCILEELPIYLQSRFGENHGIAGLGNDWLHQWIVTVGAVSWISVPPHNRQPRKRLRRAKLCEVSVRCGAYTIQPKRK